MQTIELSWGDALAAKVYKAPGGMTLAVDRINQVVGPNMGTRNTFKRLLDVESTDELNARYKWRAWLLLAALGLDPVFWGIDNEVVPPAFEPEALREALQCATRDSNPQPSDP